MQSDLALLRLLQLASPTLPVGAYSYSEALETLISTGKIADIEELESWLRQELSTGAVRMEAAVMLRGYQAVQAQDLAVIAHWHHWLSAARETEELRWQSWQMGLALFRLLQALHPEQADFFTQLYEGCDRTCNFAIAFALAAALWEIDPESALLGYCQSWLTNLIGAGVKLIPLGQTAGQKLLMGMQVPLITSTQEIQGLTDTQLVSCSWGLSLASMNHETEYSRLFRS
ncbi:urease accessory protein UreF [Neosynechococcus sphagnicola sy1]|uniref:Urease accessory protein UreF n=1 Tax=Neosynechococcus sphagnicola sy1 TaxID=1497020 RepID=A0A098TJ76_9CYAN|nr:urease accessory UreF family protein [Neosynechococcus sphagnicola]KGF72124.1 urease accessory protein UreF [Neosynechococcus sphagnicola sy1]